MTAQQATNINAYYADLAVAEEELSAAESKVESLKNAIAEKEASLKEPGSEAPAETPAPETKKEKPLTKMNRQELNAKATEVGVESPEEFDTNKEVVEAIKAKESEDQEGNE